MKEVEKSEIKRLSDRLDLIRHQQASLSLVDAAEKYAELEKEKATLETEIERLRSVHSQKLSKEAQKLTKLPFRRASTKKEQADMGPLDMGPTNSLSNPSLVHISIIFAHKHIADQ